MSNYNRFSIFTELEQCLIETALNDYLAQEDFHAEPLVDRAAAALTKLLEEVQNA